MPTLGSARDLPGRIWIGRFQVSAADAAIWAVYDTTGQLMATTTTPAGLRVLSLGRGVIIGVVQDPATDEEVIQVHRITVAG